MACQLEKTLSLSTVNLAGIQFIGSHEFKIC